MSSPREVKKIREVRPKLRDRRAKSRRRKRPEGKKGRNVIALQKWRDPLPAMDD